jgi:hypothetical protein
MPESRPGSMISKQWIKETRCYFLDFLRTPHFPECTQLQGRGSPGVYPEWRIRLIGVVAVKCKEKTDVGIHRLRTRYWQELCGQEVQAPPLAARQLRARLKKIGLVPGSGAGDIPQIFPPDYLR